MPQPGGVKLGLAVFGISLALGVLSLVVWNPPGSLTVFGIVLVIMILLLVAVANRQNWARIVLLAMYVLGVPLSIPHQIRLIAGGNGLGYAEVAQDVLQLVALIMLFRRESNAWFRHRASQPA
jgi:hypothetical protein